MMRTQHCLSNYSPTEGCLDCDQFLPIMDKVVIDSSVQLLV